MTRRVQLMVTAGVVCAACITTLAAAARASGAARRADAAVDAAALVERDAARLERLRSSRPTVGQGAEPQADALALLNAALADAGVPGSHLRSLAPDGQGGGEQSVASGYRRSALRLTLGSMTLPDVGEFLASWRATQEVWAVTQISLRREAVGRGGDEDRWTVSMSLSATYLAPDAGGGR